MSTKDRRSDIHWLNWEEILEDAEKNEDDGFFDITSKLAKEIMKAGGEDCLKEWSIDEPVYADDDRLFSRTVAYHVDNTYWSWAEMAQDMLMISRKYPEIIFMIVFTEGEVSEHTFMHHGHLTTVLMNTKDGKITECY